MQHDDVILKNGVRILTPDEYEKIISVITKLSLRLLVQVMLFTGMRYQEILRLKNSPEWFSPGRKIITVTSGKKTASENERYVHLTDAGVQAVQMFLADTRTKYPSASGMTHNLISWGTMAGISSSGKLTGQVYHQERYEDVIDKETKQKTGEVKLVTAGKNEGTERKNIYGLSVKSFRKSWESWLAVTHQDKLELIVLSQGHLTTTSLKHYLAVPFSPDEIEHIRKYTDGWMRS